MTLAIVIIVVASAASCYFAACHMALKLYSRSRLSDVLTARGKSVDVDGFAGRRQELILSTGTARVLTGLTSVLAVFDAVEQGLPNAQRPINYLASFCIAGVLTAVFQVAVPHSWARYRREKLLASSMGTLGAVDLMLRPITRLLGVFDPVIRRISGHDLEPEEHDAADEVIEALEVHENGEEIDERQKRMLQAVFELPKTTAGEVMTPRTDVKGLPDTLDTLSAVREQVVEMGHSRIPVYGESLDEIRGVLYAKDLIQYLGEADGFKLVDVLRDPLFVPESKSVSELLADFKQRTVHMAIVLDEYGGTAGLVTIEDILEELVGEIHDEYETAPDEPAITEVASGAAEVDARVEIDELERHFDLDFPDDADYDTVGGFVFSELGHIPESGERFEFDGCAFTVLEAERTRVIKVRVERLADARAGVDAA
ncbi:MAG: hemolysin family protein [Planctomycetota bacterium]